MISSTVYGYIALLSILYVSISVPNAARAYKILVIPIGGNSHVFSSISMSEALVKRGHRVHILLPSGFHIPSALMSDLPNITLERYGRLNDGLDYQGIQEEMTMSMLERTAGISDLLDLAHKYIHKENKRLLVDSNDLINKFHRIKFDVAIVESIYFVKSSYLIPHRLGIPWITYSDLPPFWLVKVPQLPSFVPSKLTPFSDKMSFVQRLFNTICIVGQNWWYSRFDPNEEILNEYRKYGHFTSMNDLISRSILFISSRDIALDYPLPSMPNTIQVGGLTAKPASGKPLPNDIEDAMSCSSGVILMTFGSMASKLPLHMIKKFIEAFRQFPTYTVIWRLENRDNITFPHNVMLAHWVPQNEILADPRVKLFITHSGNNGQFEALYHAVPMIGFPILGDQAYNSQRLVSKGYGLAMNLHSFTSEQLVNNIRTILTDKSYAERIRKGSEIFKAAKEPSNEKAAYWIEHVLRFGGDHLRSAGSDLNIFEYLMLDILLVTVISLLFLGAVTFFIFKFFIKHIWCYVNVQIVIAKKKLC